MRARTNAIWPRRVLGALSLAVLTACSLAPTYERPPAPVPQAWTDGTDAERAVVPATDLGWQGFVVDPALRDLIGLALANNRDLRQSLLNVDAARAQYRVQRAERLPAVSLNASATRQRIGERSPVESSYQVDAGLAAFELDLFGRVRNLSEASLHAYLATQEAGHTARISLVAEVIAAYLTRDGALRRHALALQVLQARETSLGLTEQLRSRGFVNELDYQEAAGLRDQTKVELERIDRELRRSSNALCLLLGVPDAGAYLPKTHGADLLLVQEIAPRTPSTVLMRRPDILAAEHRLQAGNAHIGAARAAFFPRISLTGSLGTGSTELSGLFGSGTRSWSFSPQISLPIFNGGANQANLDLALVRKDIAIAAYEYAIQTAFREVSDALAASDTLKREQAAQAQAVRASGQALRLSEARYRGGLDDHLRLLEAQRNDFSSRMALIEVQTQRQIALSTVFRALGGGGWGELSSTDAVSAR